MIDSINSIHANKIFANRSSPVQTTTSSLFAQVKKATVEMQGTALSSQSAWWTDPVEIVTGGIWSGLLVFSTYYAIDSLYELHTTLQIEHPAAARFEKIVFVVKKAFVDVISFCGTTAYTIYWAHQVKILSLGKYAPLLRGLELSTTVIVNGVEAGAEIYHIYIEKEAILAERSPVEEEKHKQRLCLALLKLVGRVSMLAWATLSVAAVASGIALSPILLTSLLGVSGIFTASAYFYEMKVNDRYSWFPKPSLVL